jgi:hypothetical protein
MLIVLLVWLTSIALSAWIFQSKNRNPAVGAALGFALGLIGVVIAACLSERPGNNLRMRTAAAAPVAATMAPPTALRAPGWYPDPSDVTKVRYWDGDGWTTYTDARQTG